MVFREFFRGLTAPFKGFELVLRPGIKRYALLPFVVNFVIFGAVIYYGAYEFSTLVDWLLGQMPQWLHWLNWLLWIIFAALSLLIVFYLFTFVIYLVGFPFNTLLATRVDRDINGHAMQADIDEGFWTGLKEDMRSVWQLLRYQITWSAGLLVLSAILIFIPLINIVVPIIWFIFSAWMIALTYSDLMLDHRGHRFASQRVIYRRHRARVLGFGCVSACLTLIPFVNLLVLPAATAGAVWLWQDIPARQE